MHIFVGQTDLDQELYMEPLECNHIHSKLGPQLSPIGRHCKWCHWRRLGIYNHIGATSSQAKLQWNSPSYFCFCQRTASKKTQWIPDTVAGVIEPGDNTAGPPKTKTVAAALAESQPRSSIRPLHGQELGIGNWDLDKIALGIAFTYAKYTYSMPCVWKISSQMCI